MGSYLFSELIPSILQNDKYVLGEDESYTAYPSFLVNRALSLHQDSLFQANEMNQYPGLDRKMQYDFLRAMVERKKRPFVKWHKPDENNEFLDAVKKYYDLSDEKAKVAVRVLTTKQLSEILDAVNEGK